MRLRLADNAGIAENFTCESESSRRGFAALQPRPPSHRQIRRRGGEWRRTAGVTLAELLVVVLLLAIVSTIAVPRFANTLNSTSVKTAAQRIARDIVLVRSWARITSQSQSISFDTVQNTYTMPGVPNPNHSSGSNTVALSDGTLHATLASANLGAGSTTLTFNGFGVPIGLPPTGGTVGVSSGSTSSTILVDSISGFVTIP